MPTWGARERFFRLVDRQKKIVRRKPSGAKKGFSRIEASVVAGRRGMVPPAGEDEDFFPQKKTVARKKKGGGEEERTRAGGGGRKEFRVPIWWVKTLVGVVLLLPVALVLTQAFFASLTAAASDQRFWLTDEFWFFSAGAIFWLLLFFTLPRPMWFYVFGHEATHAVFVKLTGGEIHGCRVSSKGGYILANKVNTLIALAPYFVPFYTVLVLFSYGFFSLFFDTDPYYRFFWGAVGFTWAFHFSFTCLMLPKRQSDLSYGGHFFSLLVIYIANILVLSLVLFACPHSVGLADFFWKIVHYAGEFSSLFLRVVKGSF